MFELLDRLKRDEGNGWDFLALAPHAFNNKKGLFGAVKSQMLRDFPSERLSALELGDETVRGHKLACDSCDWETRHDA